MSTARTLLSNGRIADPFNLKPEDVTIDILSHALANINRYSGHCKRPYSVAQHSVAMASLCEPGLEKACLLHDASEIFTGDIPYPIKKILGKAYDDIEEEISRQIFDIYGVPYCLMGEIEDLDRAICQNEKRAFFDVQDQKFEDAISGLTLYAIPWYEAKQAYYEVFRKVFHAH